MKANFVYIKNMWKKKNRSINLRFGILIITFRVRKRFGAFEKRAPDPTPVIPNPPYPVTTLKTNSYKKQQNVLNSFLRDPTDMHLVHAAQLTDK